MRFLVRRHEMRENLSQQVPKLFSDELAELNQLNQNIACGATESSETSEKLEVWVKKSD